MNIAQQITQQLGGTWHGTYGMVCCPTHNDRTPSLSVSISDEGGLRVRCFAGCDWRDVKDELRRLGHLEEWTCHVETGARQSDTSRQKLSADRLVKQRDEFGIQKAKAVYASTKPATDTLVPVYLSNRGITDLLPPSIRGKDSLHHFPSGKLYPAMVSAVCAWPGQEVTGIHRTYLSSDGLNKAGTSRDKMMLGSCSGGAVRIGLAGELLLITEGIETGLSVSQATGLPTWAALSAGGIKTLKLPPASMTKRVIICADNDAVGINAANYAAEKWCSEGRTVFVAVPPEPGTDFNDLLGAMQ
jgi:putative DNA primase/helicase